MDPLKYSPYTLISTLRRHAGSLATAAILMFAVQLWLIDYVASRVPFLDQWDGIAQHWLLPWLKIGHPL
jgi:hypothetical protein